MQNPIHPGLPIIGGMIRPALLSVLIALCAAAALAGAQDLDAQRPLVRSALEAAERGQAPPSQDPALAHHPLRGWIEFAQLKRDIDRVGNAQAQEFLQRNAGQAVAAAFRSAWLPALARRKDWDTLLANWQPTDNIGLALAHACRRN